MDINKCPISGSEKKTEYLDLGDIPLVNNLCKSKEESLTCKGFPLALQIFEDSLLTSLTSVIPPEELFCSYLYKSGVSKPYADHCSDMFDYIERYVDLFACDLVVDIGGNDGTLLKQFKKKNKVIDLLNIDPCSKFEGENLTNGIDFYPVFFNEYIEFPSKAKLITSTNVFQHTELIASFVKGVAKNLDDNGVWCLEFPYWFTTMITNNYDQIYHEHIYYYCLKNICDLLDKEGLKPINVSYHNIHAGTMRVISAHKDNPWKADSSVQTFLSLESIITKEFCKEWGVKITDKIKEMRLFLLGLTCRNNVAGFGAAAKGCVFLNTCKLDSDDIMFVIDDTPEKQGKFIPGTGIEIVDRSVLKTKKIDYILILAHNFKDYIINSLRQDGYEGRFIVMFPSIEVI